MSNWKKRLVVAAGVFVALNLFYILFLRSWHMRWGTTRTEFHAALPGDELTSGSGHVTHAITINAAPEQVWPWLMQIGQDRSGFYSYTFLENLIGCEMPEVHRIVPEWQTRKVGETVWFGTPKHFDGKARMMAVIVEANRVFVLGSPANWEDRNAGILGTWGFFLQEVDGGKSRLIIRAKGTDTPSFSARLANFLFWEPAHFIMERKMMNTLKELAERNSAAKPSY